MIIPAYKKWRTLIEILEVYTEYVRSYTKCNSIYLVRDRLRNHGVEVEMDLDNRHLKISITLKPEL